MCGHSETIQVLYNDTDMNRHSHNISRMWDSACEANMAKLPQVLNHGCWALLCTECSMDLTVYTLHRQVYPP